MSICLNCRVPGCDSIKCYGPIDADDEDFAVRLPYMQALAKERFEKEQRKVNHIPVPEGAISERGFILLNRYGNPVSINDAEQTFKHETVVVAWGASPRHPGSEGRIHVMNNGSIREFYPSVISAQWVKIADWQAGVYAPKGSNYRPEHFS